MRKIIEIHYSIDIHVEDEVNVYNCAFRNCTTQISNVAYKNYLLFMPIIIGSFIAKYMWIVYYYRL